MTFDRPIPAYVWGLVIFVVLVVFAVVLDRVVPGSFDGKISIVALTSIPLFFVTIIELARTHRVQTAELVRAHMTQFLSNQELYTAFHDLIYRFDDSLWKKIKLIESEPAFSGRVSDEMRLQAWARLEVWNANRNEGNRHYHPRYFQESREEQRLDAVLQFFDVIAYSYRSRVITLAQIDGVASYHLAVIGSRAVIRDYFDLIEREWKDLPYDQQVGASKPYSHLRVLLSHLERYNKQQHGRRLLR